MDKIRQITDALKRDLTRVKLENSDDFAILLKNLCIEMDD